MPDLSSPAELRALMPLTRRAAATAERGLLDAIAALGGGDSRLLVVLGPCSVHDAEGAREYARNVKPVAERLSDDLIVVLRCYVEKSRTGNGWPGVARDPALDRSAGLELGLKAARGMFIAMLDEGLPAGTEIVSPFLWPYWSDAVSWASVGARGVEAQSLRESAQAMGCACGFKNGKDGRIETALNAIEAANAPGSSLAIGDDGRIREIRSRGNPLPHLILRGGDRSPNWRLAPSASAALAALGLPRAIVVDASHGNSRRHPAAQARVAFGALSLRDRGVPIRGIMVESYLEAGRQPIIPGTKPSARQSLTDPCLGLADSINLLEAIAARIRKSRPLTERLPSIRR